MTKNKFNEGTISSKKMTSENLSQNEQRINLLQILIVLETLLAESLTSIDAVDSHFLQ